MVGLHRHYNKLITTKMNADLAPFLTSSWRALAKLVNLVEVFEARAKLVKLVEGLEILLKTA